MIKEEATAIEHGFHRAWTLCVGTKTYDKSIWKEAAAQLYFALSEAEDAPDTP